MVPPLRPGLQDGDPHQQLPQLGRRVDPELAGLGPAEEGAEDRLDDVLAVDPGGDPAGEVLLGDAHQPPGVPGEHFVGGGRVAAAEPVVPVARWGVRFHARPR